jgi:DNA topoisomerase-1
LIISTLKRRGYLEAKEGRFYPLELGFVVNDLLVEYFPDIVDIGFTAQMEEKLDGIARGEQEWVVVLQDFYPPFEEMVERATAEVAKTKIAPQPTSEICPLCGKAMVIRSGRYGKFLGCSGYPKCKGTKTSQRRMEQAGVGTCDSTNTHP